MNLRWADVQEEYEYVAITYSFSLRLAAPHPACMVHIPL